MDKNHPEPTIRPCDLFGAVKYERVLREKFFGIPRLLIEMRARIRIAFGFCPNCNSDAPEMHTCWVCHGYTWNKDGVPTPAVKRKWLHRWKTGEDPQ